MIVRREGLTETEWVIGMHANRSRIKARRANEAAFAHALASGRIDARDIEAHQVAAGMDPDEARTERYRSEGLLMAAKVADRGGGR